MWYPLVLMLNQILLMILLFTTKLLQRFIVNFQHYCPIFVAFNSKIQYNGDYHVNFIVNFIFVNLIADLLFKTTQK